MISYKRPSTKLSDYAHSCIVQNQADMASKLSKSHQSDVTAFCTIKCNDILTKNVISQAIMSRYEYDVFDSIASLREKRDIWQYCQINHSRPDGHCLLYSIESSLKLQMFPPIKTDTESLLHAIYEEMSNHPERYTIFVVDYDLSVLTDGFIRYAKYKDYDTLFGDVVVRILANVLKMCFILIVETENGRIDFDVVEPDKKSSNHLFLHKRYDHYNGISPISRTPKNVAIDTLCNDPHGSELGYKTNSRCGGEVPLTTARGTAAQLTRPCSENGVPSLQPL